MKRDYTLYLDDICKSIDKIEKYTEGYDFERFKTDDKTISACVREIEVIGEAAKQIPAEITKLYLNIPWSLMAKMRDKLIHWYFEIDEEIVWNVIKEQFPALKLEILVMKAEISSRS